MMEPQINSLFYNNAANYILPFAPYIKHIENQRIREKKLIIFFFLIVQKALLQTSYIIKPFFAEFYSLGFEYLRTRQVRKKYEMIRILTN